MVATSSAYPAADASLARETLPPADDRPPSDESQLATALERDLRVMLRALRGTAVEEIRLQWGGVRIALRRDFAESPATAAGAAAVPGQLASVDQTPPAPPRTEVKAHMVGPFHRSREPDGPALADVGDRVEAGRPIGIIETLGMATDVEAPVAGTLEQFVVEDGQPVEYGQVLAVIATDPC